MNTVNWTYFAPARKYFRILAGFLAIVFVSFGLLIVLSGEFKKDYKLAIACFGWGSLFLLIVIRGRILNPKVDKGDAKVLSDINQFGWHVTLVQEDDKGPGFAFSIGFYQNYKHPEIIIIGLRPDTMQKMINVIGEEIKKGLHYENGKDYSDILEGFECNFRLVLKHNYKDYLGYALWYYKKEDFPVLQCVWPDKSGKFPWDESFDKTLASRELRLDVE